MLLSRLHRLFNSVGPTFINDSTYLRLVTRYCRFFSSNSWNKDNDGESKRNDKLLEMVVTSLRVDRVAASGLGLARRKVDHSLLGGHVFLNGNKVTKKSRQVIEGDIIARILENQPRKEEIKFGQVKVVAIGELTKKGNFHIEISRNKSLSLPVQEFWKSHK